MEKAPPPCCGACGHAAAVALAGGPPPNPNPHLRVPLDPAGVPRGAHLVLWTELSGVAGEPRIVPVNKPYLILGRTRPADVVVPMAILSRRQCAFDFSTGEAVVEDLESACGTYVNGAQVRRAALRAGDRVTMADLVIEVRVD
jgi:hypothetical protein